MHIGISMECDYRPELTQQAAFDEAFMMADEAERLGLDGVWLAERHFASNKNAGGVPSIVSAPLILATAISERTERIRVGIGVLVLPLGHPIRMAEEVAMLDNICKGRLDLGVGRSGFTTAYEGYDLPYAESRARFQEYLEVMRLAWTEEGFSYEGATYSFNNLNVIPKPYQSPYPPLWAAATTKESFTIMAQQGLNILVGLRGMTVPELASAIVNYKEEWGRAGHADEGQVILRIPVYVSEDMERALSEPEESVIHAYARLMRAFTGSIGKAGTTADEERSERSERLSTITYEDLLRDRLAYGTPDSVTEKLTSLRDELSLSGFIMESNVGGRIPQDKMLNSVRLFAEEVAPQLRA